MNDFTKQGWVRFYRKSMDSTVWKNPKIWFVWSWCMLKANHVDKKFPFNGEDILIKKGSFITGLLSAQKELPQLTTQNIRTAFNYLKLTGRITIQSNNKFSVITIVKWEEYQSDSRQTNKPLTNEQQTTNKPLTTNKKYKNKKNDKNIYITPQIQAKEFFEKSELKLKAVEYISSLDYSYEEAKKLVTDFVLHWTEPNDTGTKVKWQFQKTFDIKRRLRTWINNDKKWNKKINNRKGIIA